MTRLALRTLIARPLRTALSGLAIVLGVGLVAAALTVGSTVRGGAETLIDGAYGGTDAVLTAPTAFKGNEDDRATPDPVPAAALATVRSLPAVETAIGDVMGEAQLVGGDREIVGGGPYFGVGFDARTPGAERLSPFELRTGRWAAGPGEVVVDAGTARKQHYAVGDRVRVAGRGPVRAFRVVGTARFGGVDQLGTASVAVFDLATAQRLFGRGHAFDGILVAAKPGQAAALERELATALPALQIGTGLSQDRFSLKDLQTGVGIVSTILLAFGLIALLVGAFTIVNTLAITLAQRTRELALLRALGGSRGQVRRLVAAEALFLGAGASVVGLPVGYGLAAGVLELFASVGMDLPRTGTTLTAGTVVAAVGLGTGVTLLASILPARRATRIAPVAVMREDGGAVADPGRAGRAVRALVAVVGRPGAALGGTAGRLARRNAMRMPGRTLATASALAIGVTLVTGVAVVGNGLKHSAIDTQKQRLAADYVVSGADGWSPVDPGTIAAARRAPGVEYVSALRQEQARVAGRKTTVTGVDAATVDRAMRLDLVAGSDRGLSGPGAVVRQDLAQRRHLRVGSAFGVTTQAGRRVDLVVRGIMRKPRTDTLGLGDVYVAQPTFARSFRTDPVRLVLVGTGGGVSAGRRAALKDALAAFPGARVTDTDGFVEDQAAAFDQLLAVFYVLLALAVIVSLLGIVNTLALAVVERKRELGMLRAVGMSRRQVRRMIRHESVTTALLGTVTGIVLGLALAGVAVALLADEGFAYAIPAGTLGAVLVVSIVAGVLAAALPARRAARLDPLEAVAHA